MTYSLNARRSSISCGCVFEPCARRPQTLGQRPASERDGKEAAEVDRHGVLREPQRRQLPTGAEQRRSARKVRASMYCTEHERQVQHRAQRARPAARRAGSEPCWPR